MKALVLGWLRSYVERMRDALHQPLCALLFGLHGATIVASLVLVVIQIESPPLRLLATAGLGILAAFALTTPGGGAGLTFLIGAGLGYLLLSTFSNALSDVGPHTAPPSWQVLLLATTLFVSHALDALRATLPTHAAGDPDVLVRWLRRSLEALVPGLLLGAFLLDLPRSGRGGVFWLVGGLGLLLAVGLPSLTTRPRPWRTDEG